MAALIMVDGDEPVQVKFECKCKLFWGRLCSMHIGHAVTVVIFDI